MVQYPCAGIAEADDFPPWHCREALFPILRETCRGLTDDKHLSLDGRPLFVVGRERVQRDATRVSQNRIAGSDHVRDVQQGVTRRE